MKEVEVKLLGPIIQLVGKKRVSVKAETIEDILKSEELRQYLYRNNELNPFVRIYVNGKDIRFLGLDYKIREGNEILILSAVGGGSSTIRR